MNLARAQQLLGTTDDSSPDDIRRAYRAKAFEAHPDRGGSADALDLLTKARDAAIDAAKTAWCYSCGGRGHLVIMNGFFSTRQMCATCGGTGKRWP
jgi:DnaJ-class molecular chaperone